MQFTSTAREDISYPPSYYERGSIYGPVRAEDKPWLFPDGCRFPYPNVRDGNIEHVGATYDPRPGFRPPPNPILVAFREEVHRQREANWLSLVALARLWLDRNEGADDAFPEHVEHARLVLGRLTRLANVYKEA